MAESCKGHGGRESSLVSEMKVDAQHIAADAYSDRQGQIWRQAGAASCIALRMRLVPSHAS